MRIVLVSVLTLLYPIIVYFGIGHFEPRYLAFILASLALLRAFATKQKMWLVAAIGALMLSAVSAFGNHLFPLKLYPVLVNAVLLLTFGTSLFAPPTIVERLARLQDPNLPANAVAYTRKVTQVWCVFFIVNGSIALTTALAASDAVWALYNGLIAYVLMGILFAGEWLVRRRVQRRIKMEQA